MNSYCKCFILPYFRSTDWRIKWSSLWVLMAASVRLSRYELLQQHLVKLDFTFFLNSFSPLSLGPLCKEQSSTCHQANAFVCIGQVWRLNLYCYQLMLSIVSYAFVVLGPIYCLYAVKHRNQSDQLQSYGLAKQQKYNSII